MAVGTKAPLNTSAVRTPTDAVAAGNSQSAQLIPHMLELQGRQAAERAAENNRLRRELMQEMGEVQVRVVQTLAMAFGQAGGQAMPPPPPPPAAYPFPGLSPFSPAPMFQPLRM